MKSFILFLVEYLLYIKLIISALALVSAQFNDFANLNDLFASLTENLAVAPAQGTTTENVVPDIAAPGARYVVATTTLTTTQNTTPPTQPPVTSTAGGCWKCDAMTYGQCAAQGSFELCAGDTDTTTGQAAVCFLELRETNQQLQQLCTGCKDVNACNNLKAQNFVGSAASARAGRFNDQCKNEWFIQTLGQRYGSSQSTCRTCFAMCTDNAADSHKCFGGLNTNDANADFFLYPTFGSAAGELKSGTVTLGQAGRLNSAAKTRVQTTHTNPLGVTVGNIGIPTGVFAPNNNEISDPAVQANQLMWGAEESANAVSGNGKSNSGRGNNPVTSAANDATNMYLYWAIQDAPKAWWEMDLVQVASAMQSGAAATLAARISPQVLY